MAAANSLFPHAIKIYDQWLKVGSSGRIQLTFPDAENGMLTAAFIMVMDQCGIIPPQANLLTEVLVVLEGAVIINVEGRKTLLKAGKSFKIPAGAAYQLRNVGIGEARAVGFFDTSNVVKTFKVPPIPVD